MKTKLLLAVIAIGFVLSSFITESPVHPLKHKTQTDASKQTCEIFGITQLMRNNENLPVDMNARLYFCSGNVFSMSTVSGSGEGSWIDNKTTIVITTSVPDASWNWINGQWTVLERSEWTMNLQRSEGSDTWKLALEGRAR